MIEQWKTIDEFPQYSVSNLGRVKNNKTNRIMVGGFDKNGYKQVTISHNKHQYNRRICRLVAIAFIPNPNNLPCVNHIDENKQNDKVINLEWCTFQYNNDYGLRTQKTRRKVKCVETGIIWDGLRVIERDLGISHSSISQACRKGCVAGGYHWQYV